MRAPRVSSGADDPASSIYPSRTISHNRRAVDEFWPSPVSEPNLALGPFLEPFGGPDREFAAAMRCFAIGGDGPGRKDMLLDIATEKLGRLEGAARIGPGCSCRRGRVQSTPRR